jgi:hypothetical protein
MGSPRRPHRPGHQKSRSLNFNQRDRRLPLGNARGGTCPGRLRELPWSSEKLRESLILAAEDMAQAKAAADAVRTETSDDESWRRALETAMAVVYMRPFTKGAWTLPTRFRPTSELGKELHQRLKDLRNEVYAHSALRVIEARLSK